MDTSKPGRRHFVRTGLAGLAGAALSSACKSSRETSSAPAKKTPDAKIIYRSLGRTGIRLPIVSMGAVSFDPGLYRLALASGIRHFDTAPAYRNGNHERMLGQVFKGLPRDSFVVATSFDPLHYLDRENRTFRKGTSGRLLLDSLEGSLRRLGLDHVDIFYLSYLFSHGSTLYGPFVEALQKAKQEGKIRCIGGATHENEPEVLRAAAESGIYDAVLTVYNFRQVQREEMNRAISQAARAGIGIVAMKTQAGASWDSESQRLVNMTAALKWALQNESVHTAIPGITTAQQLETDLAVMQNLALTDAEKSNLESVGALPYRFTSLFCQQCRRCVPQCPYRLEIPTLMRGYMYAYGYRSVSRARETLREAGLAALPCAQCSSCPVRCAVGFDVRSKALDLARIIC